MSKKKRDIYDIDAETAKSMLIEDNMSSIEEIIKNDISDSNILDDYESGEEFFNNLGKMIENKSKNSEDTCDPFIYSNGNEEADNVKQTHREPDSTAINAYFIDDYDDDKSFEICNKGALGIVINLDRLMKDSDDETMITEDYMVFVEGLMRDLMISVLPALRPSAVFTNSEITDDVFKYVEEYDTESFVFYRYDSNIVFAYHTSEQFWNAVDKTARYAVMNGTILSLIQSLFDISRMNGINFTLGTPYDKVKAMLIEEDSVKDKMRFKEEFKTYGEIVMNNGTRPGYGVQITDLDYIDPSIADVVKAVRIEYNNLLGDDEFDIDETEDECDTDDEDYVAYEDAIAESLSPNLSDNLDDTDHIIGLTRDDDFLPDEEMYDPFEDDDECDDSEDEKSNSTKSVVVNNTNISVTINDDTNKLTESDVEQYDSLMDDIDDDDFEDPDELEEEYFVKVQPRISPIKKSSNKSSNNDGGMVITRRK